MAVEVAEGCGVVDHGSRVYGRNRADKDIIWMKEFIGELGIRQEEF